MINATPIQTWDLCSIHNTGGWVPISLDLSSYAGQSVSLEFRVQTDNSLSSTLYLDDVSFAAAMALSSDKQPAPDTEESTRLIENPSKYSVNRMVMDNKPKSDSISLNQFIKNTMTEY